ncbi:acid type B receptor subunit 2 [Seminavis robusta]|uniref:Acid type B receptor subunit 2 n=1 Tax=Seminavis robusta TaxID=568900 RepID=A0A9N8DY13_9STRA|nr:acid type B receptor subunit 2 [Seminavis robusta]|eukprot:Sro367_g127830.1 acid type B receptor subunit 2 (791) ;mRNA; f:58597-61099
MALTVLSLRRLLMMLLWMAASAANSLDVMYPENFPSNVTLRAAVLTHAEPFAMRNELTGEYSGLQPDLLERIKIFAQQDGVELNIVLEEAPLYGYVVMLDRLSDNCNTTVNPQPLEECTKYDFLMGDYYTNPDRSLRVDFAPPFLRTAVSAMQYVFRQVQPGSIDVTTLDEANQANATICVLHDSYMDALAMENYPDATYQRCEETADCIAMLKDNQCALFVDDELQLRHRVVDDPTLQVTQESQFSQFIAWPMRSTLDPVVKKLLQRWMYAAKSNATLDALFDKYFSVNLCPVGKAGPDCDQPCHPGHGRSDRMGDCICESTKWVGDDCSVEVLEDTRGIPSALRTVGYVLVGVNGAAVLVSLVWLFWNRNTPQVQVAQPFFLCLVLLGCLISTSTIIPMAQENLNGDVNEDNFFNVHKACMAIPWLYSVGFSITFGTLFAKIRRVYLLFQQTTSTRKISVGITETVGVIGIVLMLDVAILLAWSLVDPLRWERTILMTDKYGSPLSSEGHCTCDNWQIFTGLIAAFHFTLLGLACYLCYVSRDIPTKFSEGKYLAVAMISNLQVFVVALPVLVILGSDPKSSFFVRSIIIAVNDFMVIALIFGNLMYSLWYDRSHNVDSQQAMRSAAQQYSIHKASKVRSSFSNFMSTNSNFTRSENLGAVEHLAPISETSSGDEPQQQPSKQSKSLRSSTKSTGTASTAVPKKRERAADSWGGMGFKSTADAFDDDSEDEFDDEELGGATREREPDNVSVTPSHMSYAEQRIARLRESQARSLAERQASRNRLPPKE